MIVSRRRSATTLRRCTLFTLQAGLNRSSMPRGKACLSSAALPKTLETTWLLCTPLSAAIQLRVGRACCPSQCVSGDELKLYPAGVFFNRGWTKRILGVSKAESDLLLEFLYTITENNHDLQVRFRWGRYGADIAIWDNRSSYHTAIDEYIAILRPMACGSESGA